MIIIPQYLRYASLTRRHLVYRFKPTFIFRDTLDLTGLQGHPAGNLRQGDGRNRGPIPGTQSLSTRKKVFGKIVALGSFIELSELYRSASAAKKASSAQPPVAESAHRQLRGLFDGKIVSLNRLEKSKIDWIAARSRSLRLKALQDGASL